MTLAAFALAALLSFPQRDPEAAEDYAARMGVVAAAIESAVTATPHYRGEPRELASALVALAWYEGGLLRRIHAGACRPGECDWVHVGPAPWQGYPRARSLWQLHATRLVPAREWATLTGTDLDATTRAATAAARVLTEGRRRCGSLTGALSAYAGSRSCRWRGAPGRAWTVRRLLRENPHD